MRKKRYWYRTSIPRDSGIYWVDFCFYWFRIILNERVVKEVVFKKRLRLQSWHHDKDICRGYWDEFERRIYLNLAIVDGTRKHIPVAKTFIHELYHVLDPGASESYVHDIAEQELWELCSEIQRAFLRRYLRKQLSHQ